MKTTLNFSIKLICAYLAFFVFVGGSESKQIVSSKDRKNMAVHTGFYVDRQLLDEVRKTKFWKIPHFLSAVNVAKNGDGYFIFSWHEASTFEEWREQRLIFQGSAFHFVQQELSESTFIKVGDAMPSSHDKAYSYDPIFFNTIFEGCYFDQLDRKWCFDKNQININKKTYKAYLVLDRSELPEDSNVVKVNSEKLFWLFKPVKDGWLVLKSDYVTGPNFKPLYWEKPWMKLRSQKSPK